MYGLGHSEELVGRLLREQLSSEPPLVFTVCGLIWDQKQSYGNSPTSVLKRESIGECDASLRR